MGTMRMVFKNKKRKVSLLVTTILFLSMLLPVLSYAMTAHFDYGLNGKLNGAVDSKDPDSVHVVKNVAGVQSTLTIDVINNTYKYNDANELYYEIVYQSNEPTKPTSLSVSDSTFPQGYEMIGSDLSSWTFYDFDTRYERLSSYRMAGSLNISGLASNSFLQPSTTLLNFTPTQSLSDTIQLFFLLTQARKQQ